MTKKRLKACCGFICVFGIFLLLGTAGACDCNTIPFGQAVIQSAAGLAMLGGGAYWGGFMR